MLVLVFSAKLRGIENICTYLYKFTSCKTCTISFWVNISTFLETKYEQQAKPELAPTPLRVNKYFIMTFSERKFSCFSSDRSQSGTTQNAWVSGFSNAVRQIQVDVIEAFSSFFGIFRKLLEELPKNPISR